MMRLGRQFEIFEDLLKMLNASINPLVVIIPICDNIPRIDATTKMAPLDLHEFQGKPMCGPGIMPDYLLLYTSNGKFDMPRLINDDYFTAIKILFNNRLYISSAKLLFSFLDTIAFIDTGDFRGNFKSWLKRYADLSHLNVNEDELWEARNGLLHMSNIDSIKVNSGKVSRIIFYVGKNTPEKIERDLSTKYCDYKLLIDVVVQGLEKWIKSYNANSDKLIEFISRYDRVVSDTRLAVISLKDDNEEL